MQFGKLNFKYREIKMSMLRRALESEDSILNDETLEEDEVSLFLDSKPSLDLETESVAIESLRDYSNILNALKINNVNNSNINHVIKSALESYKNDSNKISMESLDINSGNYNQLALESIGSTLRFGLDRYLQNSVMFYKHQWNATADLFKTTNERIAKYEDGLDETKKLFNQKQSDFRDGDHSISLDELWYFFSTIRGQTSDIISDLNFDTSASNEILVKSQKEIIKTISTLTGIVGRAKLKTDADVAKFFKEIEHLPALDSFIDKKFIGDGILFNVTSIEAKYGKIPSSVTIDGKTFDKLSELARRARFNESSSISHSIKKSALNSLPYAGIVKILTAKTMTISTRDISSIIDSGNNYISNIKTYTNTGRLIKNDIETLVRNIERLADQEIVGDVVVIKSGIKQVIDYITNLINLLTSPATDEVNRSIRGAKYCNYIAKRAIYNASKYF